MGEQLTMLIKTVIIMTHRKLGTQAIFMEAKGSTTTVHRGDLTRDNATQENPSQPCIYLNTHP